MRIIKISISIKMNEIYGRLYVMSAETIQGIPRESFFPKVLCISSTTGRLIKELKIIYEGRI
jgi:hypothetical protein